MEQLKEWINEIKHEMQDIRKAVEEFKQVSKEIMQTLHEEKKNIEKTLDPTLSGTVLRSEKIPMSVSAAREKIRMNIELGELNALAEQLEEESGLNTCSLSIPPAMSDGCLTPGD